MAGTQDSRPDGLEAPLTKEGMEKKESSQVASTTNEDELKILLYTIEQNVQSIIIRDKYIRVLLTVQILLVLFIAFK